MEFIKQGTKIYTVKEEVNKTEKLKELTTALSRLKEEETNKIDEITAYFKARKEIIELQIQELNNL